ncbi:MFS transporter [Streptomyces sp. OUCMDZ-3434]|uniref:MFS transporter n=1 Tax=Streptomyces sp. OUCMDZ-3434 TaxID=1535304 RepID=UPI001E658FE4|nr:MFS transporter [Streptomyces sp. OUCMDZ-3434]
MLARGRTEEAEAVIARTEREVEESTREPLPAPRAEILDEKGTDRLTDLFKGRHLRRTAVLSGLWFVACYVNHGIATFLPSLCTDAFGVDLTAALTFSLISNATGLLGTFLIALLIDRIGRRTSLLVALTGASPALAVLTVLAAGGSLRLVFARLAVVAAVGALIAFFAVETTGRALEELNS